MIYRELLNPLFINGSLLINTNMKILLYVLLMSLCLYTTVSSQWIQQSTGTTADLGGISFLNENTGYVCGSGAIIKTTNGGTNWLNVNTINLYKPFTKIQAIDENIVYCVGMFNTIIKSTNGGVNWTILRNGPSGTGISFFALYFINSLTGWIGGQADPPYYFKTTNGGASFDSIPTSELNSRVNDFYFKDANIGLSCGDVGVFRKTTNGGLNWNYVNIPIGTYLPNFNNLSFINNNTGFTCTEAKKVFKTTDFGSNWDSLSYIPNIFPSIYHISFSSESKGWAVGPGYDVFHTTNGGLNWVAQGGWNGLGIRFINDTVGYKAGNLGAIYKTTNGGVTTFISNPSTVIKDFELKNIYPNPFNSQTNIGYNIAKSGFYTLELFNSLGRREKTLINGFRNSGEHIYPLNENNLTSGVYFLKLSNSNSSAIRKLVLIK